MLKVATVTKMAFLRAYARGHELPIRKILSEKVFNVPVTYIVREEVIDGDDFGGVAGSGDVTMKSAYTVNGDYIGDPDMAKRICTELGIHPEKSDPAHSVCSVGFQPKEQKWYGWSHRAISGYGVGDVIDDDLEDGTGKVIFSKGSELNTLEECYQAAITFADSVS
jgi:hypothetical protein